jgi:hypothetical protein
VALLLSACGGGGGGGGGGPAPVDLAPVVSVTAPGGDVEAALGSATIVTVVYADADPDSVALTDLVADLDGNPATTGDQIPIATGRPEQDGATQSVPWDLSGVPAGTYRILALTADATTAVVDDAPGFVLVNGPPSLSFTNLGFDVTVSRGARVEVRYADSDADDAAMTWLYADRDGNLDTTGDLHVIATARPELNGLQQTVVWDTTGIAFGTYRVIAMTWDGTNVPAIRTALGRVVVDNVSFATGAGSVGDEIGFSVASFVDGSSVAVGTFNGGDPVFGPGEANETQLTNAGGDDVFVARYAANGTLAWARGVGSTGTDAAYAVVGFPNGSCIVTGTFSGTVTFGLGEFTQTTLVAAGTAELFLARYNSDGTLAWAKRAGGGGTVAYGLGLAALSDGGVVATGSYAGGAVFGPGEAGATTLGWDSLLDAFVARYASDGTLVWAKRASGPGYEEGLSVATFSDGSSVVTGYYEDSPVFGIGEVNQTTLGASAPREFFLARYDANGALSWVSWGGGLFEEAVGLDVATFADGSCVACGRFSSEVGFGFGEPNETIFIAQGESDAFVARYAANGTLSWAVQQAGTSFDGATAVVAQADGSCVVTGFFDFAALFGVGDPNETLLLSTSPRDLYLARLDPAGALAWIVQAGGSSTQVVPFGLAAFADGSFAVTGYLDEVGALFGAGGNGAWPVYSVGLLDAFLARYNADGGF